jgi:hypothetical protein
LNGAETVRRAGRVSLELNCHSGFLCRIVIPRVTSSTTAESNIIDANCPIYVVTPHAINFEDSLISNNQVKEHKMGMACSTNKGEDECM